MKPLSCAQAMCDQMQYPPPTYHQLTKKGGRIFPQGSLHCPPNPSFCFLCVPAQRVAGFRPLCKRLHPRSRAPTRFLCPRANLFWCSSDSFSVAVESTSVTNNNILSFLDSAVEVPVERVYRWAACLGARLLFDLPRLPAVRRAVLHVPVPLLIVRV